VYVPDGGYSYMTTDATEFLHRLTMPGVAVAQIVHSQVEVRLVCPSPPFFQRFIYLFIYLFIYFHAYEYTVAVQMVVSLHVVVGN
jgi:hypothetical protein